MVRLQATITGKTMSALNSYLEKSKKTDARISRSSIVEAAIKQYLEKK